MSKRTVVIASIVLGCLVVLYLFTGTYASNKEKMYSEEKSNYETTKQDIRGMSVERETNKEIINRVQKDPSEGPKIAVKVSQDFINAMKTNNKGTHDERGKKFYEHLKPYATDSVLGNEDLRYTLLPDQYKLYPSTAKGRIIKVLMVPEGKEQENSHTFEITVDTVGKKVDGLVEYDQRTKGGAE